jgi:hypothetical protein
MGGGRSNVPHLSQEWRMGTLVSSPTIYGHSPLSEGLGNGRGPQTQSLLNEWCKQRMERVESHVRTNPTVAYCTEAHKFSPQVPFSCLWVQPNDCKTDVFVFRSYVHKVLVEESDVLLQSTSEYWLCVVNNRFCRN